MLNMQHQQQQQHSTGCATSANNNNNNNNFELALGHTKHTIARPSITETSFGQFGDIQSLPIDFQPITGHNNSFSQHNYGFIANLSTATKDNVIINLQATANGNGLVNGAGGNFHNDEAPTYILLQNVTNFRATDNTEPMKFETDLLIVHENGDQISEGGEPDTEMQDSPDADHADMQDSPNENCEHSSAELKGHSDENSGSMVGSDEGTGVVGCPAADEKAPDHHARRPMNAFLIFCKRHRAIVREKYPNLENRSITKILGDWWANLDKDEKICYTSLAKQYKDAFFTANPNFKWYKLPAPPLRSSTVTVRSAGLDRDLDRFGSVNNSSSHGNQHVAAKRETNIDGYNNSSNSRQTNVGIFKLADEAQMGGLNSLMLSPESIHLKQNNHNNNIGESVEKCNQITMDQNALHRELGETTSYFERTLSGSNDSEIFSPLKLLSDSAASIPSTKIGGEEAALSSPEKSYEFEFEDDAHAKKTARACKGKRYLEFMSARKLSPITKKAKPRTNSSSSITSSPGSGNSLHNGHHKTAINSISKMDYENFDHLYAHQVSRVIGEEYRNGSHMASINDATDVKLFDANDFDLEVKIKALPSRNLDKYLSRKRDTKKKKKVGTKRTVSVGNGVQPNAEANKRETAQEAKERLMMVGSQKRKARKESITRRDVAGLTGTVDNIIFKEETNVKMHTIIVPSPVATGPVVPHPVAQNPVAPNASPAASDLLILATIAEAAANISV